MRAQRMILSLVLAFLTVAFEFHQVRGQTFFDGDFPDANWSLYVVQSGNGGSATASRSSSGGHPGALRSYTNTVNQPSQSEPAIIFVFHILEDAVWNPSSQGPIVSLSFSEDRMTLPGATPAMGGTVALRQGSDLYYAPSAYAIDNGTWVTRTGAELTALDFVAADGSPTQPDFSSSGSPVYFGFMRANSRDPGFTGSMTTGGTDNWSVTICSCPHQSDFDEDGFLTSLDLSAMIDVLFAGAEDAQDSSCPSPRADFDCDGFSTSLDLSGLIDHLFAGGDGPCAPCTP